MPGIIRVHELADAAAESGAPHRCPVLAIQNRKGRRSAVDNVNAVLRAVLIVLIRAGIVVLVSLPLVVVAVQVQERLLAAPPPQLVALFVSLVFAKTALLMLFGRMLDKVDPVTSLPKPEAGTLSTRVRHCRAA